ncbi:hypothetical protein V6N12_038717 [Hibiscus sabdariffa]|uniref:Uncharacterized protein n=1 Tax=Hibiscus sabdariffa TaxID=183260 RepID=A0ABR2CCN0_9ROSI
MYCWGEEIRNSGSKCLKKETGEDHNVKIDEVSLGDSISKAVSEGSIIGVEPSEKLIMTILVGTIWGLLLGLLTLLWYQAKIMSLHLPSYIQRLKVGQL